MSRIADTFKRLLYEQWGYTGKVWVGLGMAIALAGGGLIYQQVTTGGSDTTPPTVSLTAPANGANVSGTITVSANASDNVAVTSVSFLRNGSSFATDASSPYSVSFDTTTVSNGSHTFTAQAHDAANNSTVSAGAIVTVSNGGGGSSCALPNYPDATCTGIPVGTTLTPHSGDLNVTTNNSTVNAMNVSGCINVSGTGVLIKNSKAECIQTDGWGDGTLDPVENPANPRLTIQDTEIDGLGVRCKGILGGNFTAIRVNIHGCEDGIFISENYVTLRDSYIHDLAACGECHNDGIQADDGSNTIIEHNRIYGTDTSAININNLPSSPDTTTNMQIKDNLLADGGYTLYCPQVATSNFQVVNNHFSTLFYPTVGSYGPSTDCEGETGYGNVYHETGSPISLGLTAISTQSCSLPAYPDASCTGVPSGTSLSASGGLTINTPGTVINALDISGNVVVNAANVTIKNSRITTNAMWAVENNSTGLLIQDSEIRNNAISGQNRCHNGIGSSNFTLIRVEITGCENGATLDDPGTATILDSWIHDLDTVGPSYVWGNNPHTDGIQMPTDNVSHLTVWHSTIDPIGSVVGVGGTSGIIMIGGTVPETYVWFENNLIDGGESSAALYAPRIATTNIYINRNHMYQGVYGLYTFCVQVGTTVTTFDQNVDAGNGNPITPDNGVGGGCTN